MTHIYTRNLFVRAAVLFSAVLTVVASLYALSTRVAFGDMYTEVVIADERVERLDTSTVRVSWHTNIPTTGRVVFDVVGHKTLTFDEMLGYASATPRSSDLVIDHRITVSGLDDLPQRTHYFRPYSQNSLNTVIKTVGPELAVLPTDAIVLTSFVATSTPATTTPGVPSQTAEGACQVWLQDFIKPGSDNDAAAVRNVQLFLNSFEGFTIPVTGAYDAATLEAVKQFQLRYSDEVLAPWGIQEPTGYVYLTTRKKINERFCGSLRSFPLTAAEEQIIASVQDRSTAAPGAAVGSVEKGDGGSEAAKTPASPTRDSLTDGISLETPVAGNGTTSPIDTSTLSGTTDEGRLSTVTPGTFVSSLLVGVPNVEVPFVLAIIAALLLLLGGAILFRSFRSHSDIEESMIFGTPTSEVPFAAESEVRQDRSIPANSASTGVSLEPAQKNTSVINLPGGSTSGTQSSSANTPH